MSRGLLLSVVTLLLVVATLLTSLLLMTNAPAPRVRLTDGVRTISVQKQVSPVKNAHSE